MKGRMAKTIKEIADNCGVPERLYAVDVGETMLRKKVSHLVKAPKARYSICHTGSAFCNIERMGSVEISSSRAPKKWYNE